LLSFAGGRENGAVVVLQHVQLSTVGKNVKEHQRAVAVQRWRGNLLHIISFHR
jgi:hypothetical protein